MVCSIYNALGFQATIEAEGDPQSCNPSFCKIIFTYTKNGYVGYRRLDHALLKIGWSNRKYTPGSKRAIEYMRGKYACLLHAYNFWPLLHEFLMICDPIACPKNEEEKDKALTRTPYGVHAVTNASHDFLDKIYG